MRLVTALVSRNYLMQVYSEYCSIEYLAVVPTNIPVLPEKQSCEQMPYTVSRAALNRPLGPQSRSFLLLTH